MTRQKKTIISNVSRDQAEEAFSMYNQSIAELEVLQGKMNSEITAVKDKYESKINPLQEQKDKQFEVLQVYAEENRDDFKDKKSIDFTHGTIGFRTGTPKLTTRKGFKWPAVIELIKEKCKKYIRSKEEVNKEGLIADRAKVDLKAIGLEVTQDETFYVSPKLEQVVDA